MTRFANFTDEELDMIEIAFCNEGLILLVNEVRMERNYRQKARKKNDYGRSD